MIALIEAKHAQIAELCRRYRVRRLEAFGSAAGEGFDPLASDLDFLVEFLTLAPGQRADAYFGLLEDLEDFFEHPVDLVMTRGITNPYFRQAVERTREVVYAA